MQIYNTGSPQIYYDWKHDPVEVPPKFYADIDGALPSRKIKEARTLELYIKNSKTILFLRRFALGDVLMLLPVCRQFKEEYGNKRLVLITVPDICNSGFLQAFNDGVFSIIAHAPSLSGNGYDLGIFLDGILERDHRLANYSVKHRIDIYREFLGLDVCRPVFWSKEVPPVGNKGVIFCSGGRGPIKTLDPSIADFVWEKLNSKYRKTLHINQHRKVSSAELIPFLKDARVLVTMDTAPLWLAHFTRTPTVLITGPTRAKERLTMHPLYPDGVREVSLSKMIGCEPCFERPTQCDANFDCMKQPLKEDVWNAVKDAVEEIEWKTH